MRGGRLMAGAAALLAPVAASAAQTGDLVRFIACPIYRDADSGRKSGCWLADDAASGQRWDVSLSPHKPDWNYAILVEGRVADPASSGGSTACGAAVLEPVRTSRLYDQTCTRHMLPAEGFPGRRYTLQGRFINPTSVPRKVPSGPFAERTFPIYFEYGNDFLIYQYDDFLFDQAETWLKAARPRKVIVTGFAATAPEKVSGQTIAERPELARERADMVAESLRRLIPGLAIESRVETNAEVTSEPDADGLPWQSQRRAEIRAVF